MVLVSRASAHSLRSHRSRWPAGGAFGWSSLHVAWTTSPPKIPGFWVSGVSVLSDDPVDTRPLIGGLIAGSAAGALCKTGSDSIAQSISSRARRAMTIDGGPFPRTVRGRARARLILVQQR